MNYNPAQVAFIDLETWGLDPQWHEVWEVAVIVDGVEHCWQQRSMSRNVDGMPLSIDPYVRANADKFGLDRYDWATAISWRESLLRFVDLVQGRHLVGACHWFDSERMHRLWLRHSETDEGGYLRQPQWTSEQRQHPWHYHLIDVESLAVGYLHGLSPSEWPIHLPDGRILDDPGSVGLPWKSDDLSLAVGVDPDDFAPKHSALTDARWAKAVYEAIVGPPLP